MIQIRDLRHKSQSLYHYTSTPIYLSTFNLTLAPYSKLISNLTFTHNRWELGVDSHDIKFLIKRRDAEGAESVVLEPKKVPEGTVETGVMNVTGPATCECYCCDRAWPTKDVQ